MQEFQEYKELYWSLILESGWVQAALWTLDGGIARILAISKSLPWQSPSELVESCDSALSSVAQNIPENLEPSKTVFGVPPSWVEDGQIKSDNLSSIKEACSALSLTPSGFVVIPEAISHGIKIKEGSPLTGIIIGLSQENLDVSVFRLGNLQGSVSVGRSVSPVEDVIEGLARFTNGGENLPSRFLIYDGKEAEIEEIKDILTKADWESTGQKVKFLHTPKIESVLPDEKAFFICLAGASEFGEVTGFSAPGSNVEKRPNYQTEEVQETVEPQSSFPSEQTNFVVNQDIQNVKKPSFLKTPSFHIPKRSLPKVNLPFLSKGKFVVFLVLTIFILVAGLISAWIYIPKAKVSIYVSPKNIEKSSNLTLEQGKNASIITTSTSGEKTISTTGSKTVGDKATGKVSLRNGTAKEVNLKKGVFIQSSNGLNFALSEDITIPEATSPSSPGTIETQVEAEKIGSDYNLGSSETFSVSNYPKSEVDAVASSEFSGGSSKEIKAVSKEDISSLEKDLTKELLDKGTKDISLQLPEGSLLVKDAITSSTKSKSFSSKEGDEASELTLNMELSLEAPTVKKDALMELSKNLLEKEIPSGFVLRESQLEYNFKLIDQKDSTWDVEVEVTANLLPQTDTNEITQKISGKYPESAKAYLSTIPGFSRAEVVLSPPLPGKLGIIPFVKKHISLEVVAQK